MVKLKGPAFSKHASGTLGDLLTFGKNHGTSSARQKPNTKTPPTQNQQLIRMMNRFLSTSWKNVHPIAQSTWLEPAWERKIAAYHAYLSENMKRWMLNLAPATTYEPTETGPTPANTRPNVYSGRRHFSSKSLLGEAPEVWGFVYAYKLSNIQFSPQRADMRVILEHKYPPRQLWKNLDLKSGPYHAYIRTFSRTGLWSPWSTGTYVIVS